MLVVAVADTSAVVAEVDIVVVVLMVQEAVDKGLTHALSKQTPDRLRVIAQAMRFGFSDDDMDQIEANPG